MRLHAKLWGDNLFRVFPIWLVYCTFKHTERIKYTLRTGTASQSFWKARAVGILLLSPRPYRCSPADSCVPSLSCKTHNFIYFPFISVLWKLVPKCDEMPAEHRAKHTAPVQSVEMSTFSPPARVSQHGTILHLQRNPHSQHQITRIMVNGNKRNWEKMPGFWQVSTFCPITV